MRLKNLPEQWDLIVIGGGITGAGILREAVRSGLRALLVEQNDFASGTSSRSSKLVHGGLRYLKEGNIFLTKASVEERVRLLKDAPGLVEPLGFLWPVFDGEHPGKLAVGAGLVIYDIIAGKKQHGYFSAEGFLKMAPDLRRQGLDGGFRFIDAQVDDARLVLRLIIEAVERGGHAVNYTTVREVARGAQGQVTGVEVEDTETGEARRLRTRAVISAAGWWAETLHPSPNPRLHLRPLRGSHLMFPAERLPVTQAVSFFHPGDHRPLFAIPWEGATLLGTTDIDHDQDGATEPRASKAEVDYLLAGVNRAFPELGLSSSDVLATFSGVRPVLSSGDKDPSEESREHVVWVDRGLVTITGGKLTTFRRMAWEALKAVAPFLNQGIVFEKKDPVFAPVPRAGTAECPGPPRLMRRLYGRYGNRAKELLATAAPGDCELIEGTHTLFAELPFAAKNENIRHLSDLLLRRVRLGFVAKDGGAAHLDRIRGLCEPVLDWDKSRWDAEIQSYLDQWERSYALPAA